MCLNVSTFFVLFSSASPKFVLFLQTFLLSGEIVVSICLNSIVSPVRARSPEHNARSAALGSSAKLWTALIRARSTRAGSGRKVCQAKRAFRHEANAYLIFVSPSTRVLKPPTRVCITLTLKLS